MLEKMINTTKKVAGIVAASVVLQSSPSEASTTPYGIEHGFDSETLITQQIEQSKMFVFNKVKELEESLNDEFSDELVSNGFAGISIFQNEDNETAVDIVFMEYSKDVDYVDPKTGEISKGGFIGKKIIFLEIDEKIAENKYALREFVSGAIAKELGN